MSSEKQALFETVIVALDGSRHPEMAIHPAVTLAAQGGASLALVSVAPPWEVHAREDYLRMTSVGLPVPTETKVLPYGPPAEGLIAELRARGSALACMTSHGRGAMGQALFGDVSARVVRELGAPVLVIGPHDLSGISAYTEVVVAVDGSRQSAAILRDAVALAEQIDAKLQVVQVVEPGARALAHAAGVPDRDIVETGHVSELARGLPSDVAASWEVLHHHDVAHGIVDYLSDHRSAIVAMSTHARSGSDLLAAGSVANHVVHASPCPVLLLHPPAS